MKILHSADWHLRDHDIAEATKCLNFLLDAAETERVDMVVIAGDIFDRENVEVKSLAAKLAVKTISQLADLAPVAIVTGTPSHEGTAPEILQFSRGKFGVHVSSRPEQVYLEDGFFFDRPAGGRQPEAIITLIPPPTKQWFQSASDISGVNQEIGEAMSGLFLGFGAQAAEYRAPHVLVGHFNVSGAKLSNGQTMVTGRDIEVSYDQMMMAGPDLIALGHIHLPQEIGDRAYYSSSIYPENVGENHPHGFWVHTLHEGHLELSTFVETPCRKLIRFSDDFTVDPMGTTDLEDYQGKHVVYTIKAWQDEAGQLNKDELAAEFVRQGALSAEVRITPVPRVTVRAAEVLKAETLRGEFEAMAKLRGEEIAPEVLEMADLLEGTRAEELLKMVTGGVL